MPNALFVPNRVIVRHAHGLACPRCRSPVYRVPRRWLDVLMSIFQPVRRYHCRSLLCSWKGNLRAALVDTPGRSLIDAYAHRRCRLESSFPSATQLPAKDHGATHSPTAG